MRVADSPQPQISLPFRIGIAIPLLLMALFYLTYALRAWFWQDDFGFISYYGASLHANELLDFTNFGRFVSRNIYWHYGLKLFPLDARYFYLFNLLIISATAFTLHRLVADRYGHHAGAIAGLLYFLSPATLESFSWISNSQHLLAHFFVVLFTYFYMHGDAMQRGRIGSVLLQLAALVLGLYSNIFVGVVLSLPVWLLLVDKEHRQPRRYFVAAVGIALFGYLYAKLADQTTGAYATDYSIETLRKNLGFYFRREPLAIAWLLATAIGTIDSWRRRSWFVAWLFIASAAFLAPFAFFVHQRYPQYATLAYLFFCLGAWLFLRERLAASRSNAAGLLIAVSILAVSMRHGWHLALEPRGLAQKDQVEFLRAYRADHPERAAYCFRTESSPANTTPVKEWDLPPDWWFVHFGKAYTLFVDAGKSYELESKASRCDVVFVLDNGKIAVSAGFRSEILH